MDLITEPLTLANFADGKLAAEVDAKLEDILARFASAEAGDIDLASEEATITVKLFISRDPSVGGFKCSFEEPALKLPRLVRSGTVAVCRDGKLLVSIERTPTQLRLTPTKE